jgi:hypothetical protein
VSAVRKALQGIAADAGRARMGERGDKERIPRILIELGLATPSGEAAVTGEDDLEEMDEDDDASE